MINTFEDLERLIETAKNNKISSIELKGLKIEFSGLAFLDSYNAKDADKMMREALNEDKKSEVEEEAKEYRRVLFASAE